MRLFYLLPLIAVSLFASYTLKQDYEFREHAITSTLLFPDLDKRFELFTVPEHMTRYRISAEMIVGYFASRGIAVDDGGVRYVNFTKTSPIDTAKLAEALREHYREHYPSIIFKTVKVTPRVYLDVLPSNYDITISDGSYRYDNGTFYITDGNGAKQFFDYRIDADVAALTAREDLKRGTRISPVTAANASVPLRTLKAEPLYDAPAGKYRLKRHIKSGEVILQRHVELAPLVLRNAGVLATLKSGNILIQFHAIALQDGVLHDMISIQKPDGQRLKAKVIGENRVEIE